MSGDVAALLAGIRDRRREFEAAGSRAQELRTLPPETVQTLRDMGMFWLKTPAGTGRPVAGGYVLTGRWGFASAIAQSDWLLAGFSAGGRFLVGVVPAEQAQVVDNWRVAGLQGTGSMDFRLDEVFVPAELTFQRAATACRGGALFRQEAHAGRPRPDPAFRGLFTRLAPNRFPADRCRPQPRSPGLDLPSRAN